MASISKEPNGRRRIQFVDRNSKRRSIYLGKCSQRAAESIRVHVEALVVAKAGGTPVDVPTAKWVRNEISDALAAKLAAVGLVQPRKGVTVGEMFADFTNANPHGKPATLVVWGQVARDLKKRFGEDRQLRTISRADAEGFRQFLADKKLAATTVQKRIQFARQFFAHAVQCEWIDKNPFDGITHKGGNSAERQHYVTAADTQRLIDAAPDWVWRNIIALARYGGLRCPSEVLSLRLCDLDWERGAMVVTSPKTEVHGKGYRTVPMFGRLRPYLETAWDMAAEGQTHPRESVLAGGQRSTRLEWVQPANHV